VSNHLPLPAKMSVSGVSYRQGVVALLKVGESVFVKRDPSNPYDSNACKVISSTGEELGFVPKNVAPRLSSRPERFWFGKVVEVFKGDLVGVRIVISESEFLEAEGASGEAVSKGGLVKSNEVEKILGNEASGNEASGNEASGNEASGNEVLVDGTAFVVGGEVCWINGAPLGKLLSIDGGLARVLKARGEYVYPLEFIKVSV